VVSASTTVVVETRRGSGSVLSRAHQSPLVVETVSAPEASESYYSSDQCDAPPSMTASVCHTVWE